MDGEGNITVSTANVVSTEAEPLANGLPPGEYACLSIVDDGPGIDEDAMDRIFDPFFSTKEVGKGTGLGLAIVGKIVEEHGGDMSFAPVADGGTRVILRFARYPDPAPANITDEEAA